MPDLDPTHVAAVGRVIDKTIERLPAERRLFPDLYAEQVAQRLLDSDDPAVHAALLAALARAGVLSEETAVLASEESVVVRKERRYVTRWEDIG